MTAKPQNTTAGKAYLNWLLNHLGEPVIATDENLLINYWNDEAMVMAHSSQLGK